MRIIIGFFICIILAGITSFFLSDWVINNNVIQNLYTISGIMFSIGLSLAVTFNLSAVKNISLRNRIRKAVNKVRDLFIIYFVLISFFYVIIISIIENNKSDVIYYFFRYSHLLTWVMIYSIIYFIWNFLEVQKLNSQIEDSI